MEEKRLTTLPERATALEKQAQEIVVSGMASQDLMEALHGLTTKKIIERLMDPEVGPQDIANALRLLKDNSITSIVEKTDIPEEIIDYIDLPDFEDVEPEDVDSMYDHGKENKESVTGVADFMDK